MTDRERLERLKMLDKRERDFRTLGVVIILLASFLLTGTVKLSTGLIIVIFFLICGFLKTFYLKPEIRRIEAKISKTST